MLKTIKLIILLFFVSHTSIAQISLIRKEHILLNINSGSTTLKTDKDILYNSVVQDIQEENNIILKVVIKSSTYDITDYFNFQVIKALPSLDPNTKYQEMNDEDLIQYVTQKYNEVKKNQKKQTLLRFNQ